MRILESDLMNMFHEISSDLIIGDIFRVLCQDTFQSQYGYLHIHISNSVALVDLSKDTPVVRKLVNSF